MHVCVYVCVLLASKFGQPSYVIYNQLTEIWRNGNERKARKVHWVSE